MNPSNLNPLASDPRNVQDKYKGWETDLIKEDLATKKHNFAVAMMHLGDFNFGTVVRSANAFGANEVFYLGKKAWDRRSAVGTHNYTKVRYVASIDRLIDATFKDYTPVALEMTEYSIDLRDWTWDTARPPLMIVGDEAAGLSEEILQECPYKVSIPMFGSVRSLNVGSCASIAMYDYISKKG